MRTCIAWPLKGSAAGMEIGKFLVPAADVGIIRKLCHEAAMLLPFPVIDIFVVTHRLRPGLVQAAASAESIKADGTPP